jgi:hypothetical protein
MGLSVLTRSSDQEKVDEVCWGDDVDVPVELGEDHEFPGLSEGERVSRAH